jgi:hypothetical protein
MRLVFVHGINHEGKSSDWILENWLEALKGATSPGDFELIKRQTIEAPFYGDVLHEQAQQRLAAKDKLRAQSADEAEGEEAAFYRHALAEVVQGRPDLITAERLAHAERIVEQDAIYNNRHLIVLLKALQDVLPDQGEALLRLLPQAFVYLNRIQATETVEAIVRPALEQGPCIVIAHSLGTVVSFKLMRALRQNCPFYITLGSPLPIKAVQGSVRAPFGRRPAVAEWLNLWDPNDVVTLSSPLDTHTFGTGVENSQVNNGDADAHDFRRYLAHRETAERLVAAIRRAT